MKAFGRSAPKDEKPVRMKYTGNNGAEVLEWSRDEDTTARFQWRPGIAPEDVRVFLTEPHLHWEICPPGATLALTPEGHLEMLIPEPGDEPDEKRD